VVDVVVDVEVVVVLVVEVVVGVVVGVDVHDSDSAATGPVTGSGIADRGVPGGTLTTKVCFCPVTRVTVTVQVSAWAAETGIAATTPSTELAANSWTHSLPGLTTIFALLPTMSYPVGRPCAWKVLSYPELCNDEPPFAGNNTPVSDSTGPGGCLPLGASKAGPSGNDNFYGQPLATVTQEAEP
jgi:hypothetical protein